MRHNLLILIVFLLPACTIQQQNGNRLSLQAPPLIAGNQWRITRKSDVPDVGRLCTISAGEMDITQFKRDDTITAQVATSTHLNPGDYYRVIYQNDAHETAQGRSTFKARESQAIVAELMNGGVVYTEIQQRTVRPGSEYIRLGNKIGLDGFASAYQACQSFVSQARR